MPTLRTIFVLSLCLIFQASSVGQTDSPHKPEHGAVLARLSYTSTYIVNGSEEKYLPRVCFELYRDGRYRIMRATTKGADENRAGKLSPDQLETVSKMLMQLDFNSSPGGVIRRGSESFVAEVPNGAEERRLLWVDPDHRRPFPGPVAKVIGWLRGFNSDDAPPFNAPELGTDPICPRISPTPLQTANRHLPCQ
jgi:hypothetical protein